MSRFWLVELYEDLEHLPFAPTTRTGVWAGVRSTNGVKAVTDLEAISPETLDELLRRSDCQRVFAPSGSWHWQHALDCMTQA